MKIKLIKSQERLFKISPVGNRIAEYYRDEVRRELFHIQLFDPADNSIFEVSPKRLKISFVELINCIYDCRDIYYTSCNVIGEDLVEISLYKYAVDTGMESRIFSCLRNFNILNPDRRLKIFLLNEFAVLLQTEILHESSGADTMGNIEFNLVLFNLDTGGETMVTEANFINNGVNTIIPVSDKKIMIKTGYSFLEDTRLDEKNENNALIESVFITTVAKFIADMTLSRDFVDMPLIESAYYDRYITTPKVTEQYIHFSVLNSNEKNTKCVFYNFDTDERIEYTVRSYNTVHPDITYIIRSSPYVRMLSDSTVNFINLKNTEIDVTFYDEDFQEQTGSLFILKSRNEDRRMHIYSYPGFKMVLDEKRDYERSCCIDNNYYIYC